MRLRLPVIAALGGALLVSPVPVGVAQPAKQAPSKPAPPASPPAHGDHGTPEGWKFTWPKGDPGRGRTIFAKLECHTCHEVKGEKFRAPSDKDKVGPELSMMGPLHEAEYFAEAIINPNAVIEKGKGYQAPDGTSKMPSFNDSLSVQELIDLVAYLSALKPPAGTQGHRGH
ncbi:MAG TPA: c-type cytochrome [Methylomirabilota bacterium]|nr:c-type cytochrome [Methylomirabilota bacterium]